VDGITRLGHRLALMTQAQESISGLYAQLDQLVDRIMSQCSKNAIPIAVAVKNVSLFFIP